MRKFPIIHPYLVELCLAPMKLQPNRFTNASMITLSPSFKQVCPINLDLNKKSYHSKLVLLFSADFFWVHYFKFQDNRFKMRFCFKRGCKGIEEKICICIWEGSKGIKGGFLRRLPILYCKGFTKWSNKSPKWGLYLFKEAVSHY